MYLTKTIGKTSIWFSIGILVALITGASMFFYAENYNERGKVLGMQIENIPPLFRSNVRLVKTRTNPAVYAIINNQKHKIRNEEVFYSYDYNFRNIRLISEQELNRYKLARLVKARGDSRVYYLSYEKDLKKYHPSPRAFNAYANNRWEDIIEVSSEDLSYWEEATVLKEKDSNKVYFITSDYKKSWVPSENEFINAGFQWHKVLTVNKADLDAYGGADYNINLVRRSREVVDTNPTDNTDPTVTPTPVVNPDASTQLIISMDTASPVATLIPFSTSGNIVTVLKLQAVGQKVELNSIDITKKGILSSERVSTIILEDQNGVEIGRTSSMDGNMTRVSFGSAGLVIPRDSTKRLAVKVNFGFGAEVNHNVSFGIEKESDIKGNAVISGIFPLYGETHKLISVGNMIGQVKIDSAVLNANSREVNIGSKQETISKFNFSETTGNEEVKINKIILTSAGNASDQAVDNITLYQDGKAIKNAGKMQSQRVVIDLSDKKVIVKKKTPIEITIKADILREESSTLKFVISKASDISTYGLSENYGIVISSSESFPIGRGTQDGYNKISFGRRDIGFFTVSLTDTQKKVYRGEDSAILGKFELRNTNENIYLQRMKLRINKTGSAPDLDYDFIIKNETDNNNIATVSEEKVAGGVLGDFSLNNYRINANKTIAIGIRGVIPEESTTGNTYQAIVSEITYKIGLDNTQYTNSTVASGQLMTVYAPRIVIDAGTITSGTVEAGGNDTEIASFSVDETTTDEAVKITGVVMSLTSASDDLSYVAGFSDLALYAGSRASQAIAEPSSSTYTFNNLNITVPAGGTKTLTIRADTEDYALGTVQFRIDAVTVQGYTSRASVYVEGEDTISDSVTFLPPTE